MCGQGIGGKCGLPLGLLRIPHRRPPIPGGLWGIGGRSLAPCILLSRRSVVGLIGHLGPFPFAIPPILFLRGVRKCALIPPQDLSQCAIHHTGHPRPSITAVTASLTTSSYAFATSVASHSHVNRVRIHLSVIPLIFHCACCGVRLTRNPCRLLSAVRVISCLPVSMCRPSAIWCGADCRPMGLSMIRFVWSPGFGTSAAAVDSVPGRRCASPLEYGP